MLNQHIHFLSEVKGRTLDKYLAAGWYRIYDLMFTTDSITLEDRNIPVKWLRYNLDNTELSHSSARLLRRNRKFFNCRLQPAVINAEMEELYREYREFVGMDMSETVRQSLYSSDPSSIFDTIQIELRREDRLVAAGFFDNGRDSVAGILNFYDPEFRRFSLGKYLMLEVVDHCLQKGKKFFYPGYVAEGYAKFDYKLSIGSGAEIRTESGDWVAADENDPADFIKN